MHPQPPKIPRSCGKYQCLHLAARLKEESDATRSMRNPRDTQEAQLGRAHLLQGCFPIHSFTGGTQGGEQLQQDRCPRDGFSECLLETPSSLEKRTRKCFYSHSYLQSWTYSSVGCPVTSVLLKEVPEDAHAWCSSCLGTHLLFGPFGKGHGGVAHGNSSTAPLKPSRGWKKEENQHQPMALTELRVTHTSGCHPHLGVSPPHRAATGSSWDHRDVVRDT